jgi:4a-hydroxytetrahydrobiopterin dehydratase
MTELADQKCVPCRGGVSPLRPEQWEPLKAQLHEDWRVVENHHLARPFRFKDFAGALAFVNRVGEMAEEIGHHPDIHLAWGMAKVEIWTHKIDGLHDADFVFAARCDRLYPES